MERTLNNRPRVTARDVAEKLGVSVATVGRSMADDPRISAATKERVVRTAKAMGYVGSAPARFMRSGTSNLVGLVLPDIRNGIFSAIAQALSDLLDREGYRLVLSLTGDDRGVEERQLRDLVSARVAGIILVPTAAPRRESLALLEGVPHLQLLRRSHHISGSWFGVDDERGLFEAASHLLDLGHRRIAYVGGSADYSTGAARLAGVKGALKTHGLEPSHVEQGPLTMGFGAEAVARLLDTQHPPSALLSGSYFITTGMLTALHARGTHVPGEISVVGFGDPPWAAWVAGGLTTLRQPVLEVATICGLSLLHQLRTPASDAADEEPSASSVAPRLMVRGSTARATG